MLAEINGKIVDTDFETIYKHSRGIMLTTIQKYVNLKPGDDYDDIIQLMSIDLFNAFSKGFDPSISSFKSYVMTICRRRAFLYNRENRQEKFDKRVCSTQDLQVSDKISSFAEVPSSVIDEILELFEDKLTESNKEYIRCLASGKTRQEMIEEENVSRQTISNRHARAMKKIRDGVQDKDKLDRLKEILRSDD